MPAYSDAGPLNGKVPPIVIDRSDTPGVPDELAAAVVRLKVSPISAKAKVRKSFLAFMTPP